MLLRGVLLSLALLAWLLLAWLAAHESTTPEILGRYSAGYAAALGALLAVALLLSLATFGPLYAWLTRAREAILLAFFSTVFSVLLLEGLVRWLDPLGISYYEESRRYHLEKIADPDLIYRHRAYLAEHYQGVDVRTNSMGLRDTEVLPLPEGGRRVLLLGDSVAFGWGVATEAIFATRLEQKLEARVRAPVEVVNTGVGSYETRQQLRFARRHGERLDPQLALLLYVSNDTSISEGPFDPWTEVDPAGKPPPTALRIWAWESWIYRLGFHVLKMRAAVPAEPARNSPGWRTSMESVQELQRYWAERDTPFAVALYRSSRTPKNDALLEDLQDLGRDGNFLVFDTLPAFQNEPLPKLINSVVDSHPNALGHERLAAHIDAQLAAAGYLASPDRQ